MKFYLEANVFGWNREFNIFDEQKNSVYHIKTHRLVNEKKICLSENHREIGCASESSQSLLVKFYVSLKNQEMFELKKGFKRFNSLYLIDELGWKISGNFTKNDYQATDKQGNMIFVVKEEKRKWGNVIMIEINQPKDVEIALLSMLCIDGAIIG